MWNVEEHLPHCSYLCRRCSLDVRELCRCCRLGPLAEMTCFRPTRKTKTSTFGFITQAGHNHQTITILQKHICMGFISYRNSLFGQQHGIKLLGNVLSQRVGFIVTARNDVVIKSNSHLVLVATDADARRTPFSRWRNSDDKHTHTRVVCFSI